MVRVLTSYASREEVELEEMQKEAVLYEKLNDRTVRCSLCSHRCTIQEGSTGICGVRQNRAGVLYTNVYGSIIAAHVDPIEKKPLYHFLPGSRSFSIATVGCNFKCGFCQNWQISQGAGTSTGTGAFAETVSGSRYTPEKIVNEARNSNSKSIAYTYTEPTIFFEFAYDTARRASQYGIRNVFVTNGFMTDDALKTIQPYLDAANVDLKSYRESFYRSKCRGHLQPVLDSIVTMKKMDIWIEVTTLVIPGENDSDEELNDIAEFIASTGVDIPWHLSRFHPDYNFSAHNATPVATLKKAALIGKDHGLRHVYLGNVFADTDTRCHSCGRLLVNRSQFSVRENALKNGKCPDCGIIIGGIWS